MALSDALPTLAPDDDRALRRRRLATHAAIFLGLMLLWELAARLGWANPLFLPPPTAILWSFYVIFIGTGNVWFHLWVTLTEVALGFLAGSVLGIGLAVIVGLNPLVRRFLQPYVIVLEATPRIAVAPLIIAALGFGLTSKVAIVMLVCFFAPFVNTLAGIVNVNREALELFRSLGAGKLQTFTRLMLPDAAPTIMAGLRLAMASALSGALVAEFISANEGMGVLLDRYTASLNMASTFATLLTLTALGFAIFKGMEALDRRLIFWRQEATLARRSQARARAWRGGAEPAAAGA
jgi:NitT/TauT family transport system permease protein